MDYTKIKQIVESLNNELLVLKGYVENQNIKDRELEGMANSLVTKEKKMAVRESRLLAETHSLEEGKMHLQNEKRDFDVKQNKLQDEWNLMVGEKEKLDQRKEDISRDRLKIKGKEEELEKQKAELNAQQQQIKLEREELEHMAKAIELKRARLKNEYNELHKGK